MTGAGNPTTREATMGGVTATYTVTHTDHPTKPWLVSCSCGKLHIDAPEDEVGMLLRLHWDNAHAD